MEPTKPTLVILGQATVDHVVPAAPASWVPRLGGNALYAVAGARLWMDPREIGVVVRQGTDFAFDVPRLLDAAGVGFVHCQGVAAPHLTEWILYEEDGSRRCLPRNVPLRHIGSEGDPGDVDTYLDYLLQFSPEASDVPPEWLPVKAAHLAPQVRTRSPDSLAALRHQAGFVSIDPSPYLARSRDAVSLAELLSGVDALLPSELESAHLVRTDWQRTALELHHAGIPEVLIKRGARPVLLACGGDVSEWAVPRTDVVDPTGAGDSFGGAYAACRASGLSPPDAVRRAIVAAALVIGCEGAEAALAIDIAEAAHRLRERS